MRIEDVFSYREPIMEAPYGVFQNMKDTVSSKIGGVVGKGQEAEGNKEAGQAANELYKQFKNYVGKVVGRGKKYIEAEHLIDFLDGKRIPSDIGKQPTDMITPKEAEKLIMAAQRKGMRTPSAKKQPAQQVQQPSSNEPQAQKQSNTVDTELASAINSLSSEDYEKLKRFLSTK